MLLLVIDFSELYKTMNCKETNKNKFTTHGIIDSTNLWKILIHFLINSQKLFTMQMLNKEYPLTIVKKYSIPDNTCKIYSKIDLKKFANPFIWRIH